MRLGATTTVLGATAAILSSLGAVSAHSWIEALNRIAPNGTFVEPAGYTRGFISHGDMAKGFTGDEATAFTKAVGATGAQTNEIQVCNSLQDNPKQSDGFPRLKASPGDLIAMRYLENGHVTKTPGQGRTPGAGYVTIYGSTKGTQMHPRFNDLLAMDPKGELGKGRLLTNQSFDDGRCYEDPHSPHVGDRATKHPLPGNVPPLPGVNADNMPCQHNLAVPLDAPAGQTLTMYWVWNFTSVGPSAPIEMYANCIDIDVVAPDASGGTKIANLKAATPVAKYAADQPAISAAAAVYFDDLIAGGDASATYDAKSNAPVTNKATSGPPAAPAAPAAPASQSSTSTSSVPTGKPVVPFGDPASSGAPLHESTVAPSAPAPSVPTPSAPAPSAPAAAVPSSPGLIAKGPVSIVPVNPTAPVPPPLSLFTPPASAAPSAPAAAPTPAADAARPTLTEIAVIYPVGPTGWSMSVASTLGASANAPAASNAPPPPSPPPAANSPAPVPPAPAAAPSNAPPAGSPAPPGSPMAPAPPAAPAAASPPPAVQAPAPAVSSASAAAPQVSAPAGSPSATATPPAPAPAASTPPASPPYPTGSAPGAASSTPSSAGGSAQSAGSGTGTAADCAPSGVQKRSKIFAAPVELHERRVSARHLEKHRRVRHSAKFRRAADRTAPGSDDELFDMIAE